MRFMLIFLSVAVGCAVAQQQQNVTRYVFDMYKNSPPLDADFVIDLMAAAQPGISFPLNDQVPNTGFTCSAQATPGYFADPAPPSLCQAFYRCDAAGVQTGFLCPNQTLFNQLTLTCDYYYNVDCAGSRNLYNFANSRLYQTNQPLFDTPPKGYISLLSGLSPGSDQGPAPSVRADEGAPQAVVMMPVLVQPVVVRPVVAPKPRPVQPLMILRTPSPAKTTVKSSAPTVAPVVVVSSSEDPVVAVIPLAAVDQSLMSLLIPEVVAPAPIAGADSPVVIVTPQSVIVDNAQLSPVIEASPINATSSAESSVVLPVAGVSADNNADFPAPVDSSVAAVPVSGVPAGIVVANRNVTTVVAGAQVVTVVIQPVVA